MPSIAILTTCLGRWRFLEQSYATWREHLPDLVEVCCVSDARCPDSTLAKAKERGMRAVEVGLRSDEYGNPIFHKAKMLNAGAASLGVGRFDFLLLLDADTLVTAAFRGQLSEIPSSYYFAFCRAPLTKRDLTGVLVVSPYDWDFVGGMDERFEGWGAEDLDLRLRLWTRAMRAFVRLNPNGLVSLSHSDDLRTQFYENKSKWDSLARNNAIMAVNYQRSTGRELVRDLAEKVLVQELLGLTDELTQRGGTIKLVEDQQQATGEVDEDQEDGAPGAEGGDDPARP